MCKCCQLACPECYARLMNPQPPNEPVMCSGCAMVRMTDGGFCIDCQLTTLTRERDDARREVERLKALLSEVDADQYDVMGRNEMGATRMKATCCKLCDAPFQCINGMWSTTCRCAQLLPVELAEAQAAWDSISGDSPMPPTDKPMPELLTKREVDQIRFNREEPCQVTEMLASTIEAAMELLERWNRSIGITQVEQLTLERDTDALIQAYHGTGTEGQREGGGA